MHEPWGTTVRSEAFAATNFDDKAAKWIAFAIGIGAAVLAVGTAWPTWIVRVIPALVHGYVDLTGTVALIVLPFIVGFSNDTTALVVYLVVGIGGLLATLATRFEARAPAARDMQRPLRMAAQGSGGDCRRGRFDRSDGGSGRSSHRG